MRCELAAHLHKGLTWVHDHPGETVPSEPSHVAKYLGLDSFTSYVWIHHNVLSAFPETDYAVAQDRYFAYWDKVELEFTLPYFPNVTMGWDPSPRTVQSDAYLDVGYPFTATLSHNTPEQFRIALEQVKARLGQRMSGHKILSINAWNEWTESSYLEPDTVYGTGYLQAIRDVFPPDR